MSSEVPAAVSTDDRARQSGGGSSRLAPWWTAAEAFLVRAGDRLNPILVKETRQALKSRQFTITFSVLLIGVWLWTVASLVWLGPEVWYGAKGREMFLGYYILMAFPLMVVVPFGALRSLAGEHEERTYDLLSITALGPRQIVSGKLGSAALQILVYLSALSPCLAFTYLLHGIDVLSILVLVAGAALASLGLSMIALLVGTLASEKHWQIVLGVLSVIGLFYAFGAACACAVLTFEEGQGMFDEPEFWIVAGCILTAYASYFALVFFAAVARLTFASGNRSTPLRVVMLAQQLLFVGWVAWLMFHFRESPGEVIAVCLMFVAMHWYAMGAMMTGESPELSARVKRSLPQSLLGRAFLTWFNPGPGTGYVFALCGMTGAILLGLTALYLGWLPERPMPAFYRQPSYAAQGWGAAGAAAWWESSVGMVAVFSIIALSYLTMYLGVGLILVRLLRRFVAVGIPVATLVHFLVVGVGVFLPLAVQQLFFDPRTANYGYSFLQITNVPWTLEHVFRSIRQSTSPDLELLLVALPGIALVVFVLNLPGIVREIRQVRVEKPRRVAEEEAALHPPPPPKPSSPWG